MFPKLETDRLDLIEIKEDHLKDLYTLFSNKEVVRYYNLLPYRSLTDGQKFIDWYRTRFEEKLAIRWGIALKGSRNIIGTIGFNNYTYKHKAQIGYDLQQAYWNKGYISEALNKVVDFGFENLEINRIEAEIMVGNTASEKVLQKLHFTKEGVLRHWMFWNEQYFDIIMYSLLRNEHC